MKIQNNAFNISRNAISLCRIHLISIIIERVIVNKLILLSEKKKLYIG